MSHYHLDRLCCVNRAMNPGMPGMAQPGMGMRGMAQPGDLNGDGTSTIAMCV